MSPADTAELLATVQAFTNRTVGAVDVAAWHSVLDDLPLDECRDAVVAHYRGSTDWIMPAHVRRLVKAARADRLSRTVELPPDADPDDPVAYRDALRAGRMRTLDPAAAPRDMTAIDGTFPSVPSVPATDVPAWRQARERIASSRPAVLPPLSPGEAMRRLAAMHDRLVPPAIDAPAADPAPVDTELPVDAQVGS